MLDTISVNVRNTSISLILKRCLIVPISVNKQKPCHLCIQNINLNLLQDETNAIITVVNAVYDGTGCYPHLNTFTCALLNPKCGTDKHRLPPCRSMCEGKFGTLQNARRLSVDLSWFDIWRMNTSFNWVQLKPRSNSECYSLVETFGKMYLKYTYTWALNMSRVLRPACWALMSIANPIEAWFEVVVCFYTMIRAWVGLCIDRQWSEEWAFTVTLVFHPKAANHNYKCVVCSEPKWHSIIPDTKAYEILVRLLIYNRFVFWYPLITLVCKQKLQHAGFSLWPIILMDFDPQLSCKITPNKLHFSLQC